MLLGEARKCKDIEKRGFLRPNHAKFYVTKEAGFSVFLAPSMLKDQAVIPSFILDTGVL